MALPLDGLEMDIEQWRLISPRAPEQTRAAQCKYRTEPNLDFTTGAIMVYGSGSGSDFHRTLGLISNTAALSVACYSLRHANTFFRPFFPRERAIKVCVISVAECLDASQRGHHFTSRSICTSLLAIAEMRGKYNSNWRSYSITMARLVSAYNSHAFMR